MSLQEGGEESSALLIDDHDPARGRVSQSLPATGLQQYGAAGQAKFPASQQYYRSNSVKKQMRSMTTNTAVGDVDGGDSDSSIHSRVEKEGPSFGMLVHRKSLFQAMKDGQTTTAKNRHHLDRRKNNESANAKAGTKAKAFLNYIVYAVVNVIISGTLSVAQSPTRVLLCIMVIPMRRWSSEQTNSESTISPFLFTKFPVCTDTLR